MCPSVFLKYYTHKNSNTYVHAMQIKSVYIHPPFLLYQKTAGLELWGHGLAPSKQESSLVHSDVPRNMVMSAPSASSTQPRDPGSCRAHSAVFSSTVPSPLSLLAAHMRCLHDFSSYCLAPLKDYWFCPLRCATILKNCAWPVLCKLLDHRHPLNCLVRPLFLFEPFFLHCGLGFRFQFRR